LRSNPEGLDLDRGKKACVIIDNFLLFSFGKTLIRWNVEALQQKNNSNKKTNRF
jgi:hypothetical protein